MDERYELTGALEGLGRLVDPKNSRVRSGLMTHPQDGSLDDLLQRVPEATKQLFNEGDPEAARALLKNVDSRIGGLTKVRNYGFDIEGHHPISLMSSYLAASDMPVENAHEFYNETRRLGLPIGTVGEHMLPVTRLAHDYAHFDPITAKTNKKAFSPDAMRFRQTDPIARANAWAPMGQLEAAISKSGFWLPQEQEVRRLAGEAVGISPEMLYSLQQDPNYLTPTGRPGKQTYAQSSSKVLQQQIMGGIVNQAWGPVRTMKDMVEPNQYKHTFKSPTRAPEYRERRSANPVFDHSQLRPGQRELLLRLAR